MLPATGDQGYGQRTKLYAATLARQVQLTSLRCAEVHGGLPRLK